MPSANMIKLKIMGKTTDNDKMVLIINFKTDIPLLKMED